MEEKLRRYQEAGLEARLKDQSFLVAEEQVLKTASYRLVPFREALEAFRRRLPVDCAFVEPAALTDLPAESVLNSLQQALQTFDDAVDQISRELGNAISVADAAIWTVRINWDVRK